MIASNEKNNRQIKHKSLYIIAGLTFIGLALRLYHLDFNSIWLDEAFTWFYVQNGWSQIFWMTPTDSHPPLFYWVVKAFVSVAPGDFMLRLFSALIGAATIPVFYFIGREVSDETGLWMAAFLTLSQFHIAYSQEARMYTLWLFLFAVGFVFFLRKQYGWFALFAGLSLWTHFLSLISYVTLWLLQEKDWLVSAAVYTLITFPLVWFALEIFVGKTGVAPAWGWPGPVLISEGLRELLGYSWPLLVLFLLLIIGGGV